MSGATSNCYYCFYNCLALSNYGSIPDRWKGINAASSSYNLRSERAAAPMTSEEPVDEVTALQQEIIQKQEELNSLIEHMNVLLGE